MIVAVAGPVPVEVGDFNRIKAGRREVHIDIDRLIPVAAVVLDDVDVTDLDPRAVIGCGADVEDTRCNDVDKATETKRTIIKVSGRPNIRCRVGSQIGRNGTEVVAQVIEMRGAKCPGRRAKTFYLIIDALARATLFPYHDVV